MVRSRNLGPTPIPRPRARRLEHASRACPICAYWCRSRVNPRSVARPKAAYPSRRAPRDDCVFVDACACALLRMRRMNVSVRRSDPGSAKSALAFARCRRMDGEGVDATFEFGRERFIHHTVALDPALPSERFRHNINAEMGFAAWA